MSDILTRLLLDTKGYDSNLMKAKKSTNDFASSITGKLGGAVTKLAGGIGLAMGAAEAFNKVINSSQTLGDKWNNTLSSCKGTVDAFFQSLSTGSWDAFNGGLLATLRNMREVAAMKDMLEDAKLSMGFDTRKFEREYVRLEGIIDNEKLGKAEREAAFADMQSLIANFKGKVEKTAQGAADTLVKQMNVKFGQNFTLSDLEKYIEEVNNEFLNTETLQRLNEYKAKLESFNDGRSQSINGYILTKEQFIAQNAELEKMRILQDDNDESRKNMLAQLEYAVELQRRADEYLKRSLEKQNKIANLNKISFDKVDKTPTAGSLAAIDAEIRRLQSEYANTASSAAREATYKTIKELQEQKATIEFYIKYKRPEFTGSTSLRKDATLPTKLEKININTSDIKNTQDYADSINAVANAITAVGSASGEGAAAFLSWAASAMTASAQAVSSIKSVVAAKTAEGAASAGAEAAKTPFIGWMLIGGAIASALAAFASIPKFAEGGIVGGSSYFGDKLLARVNSGEMILNQGQQARLLSMTDNNNVRVSGDVRLSGKDIYISLRNYMSSTGNRL